MSIQAPRYVEDIIDSQKVGPFLIGITAWLMGLLVTDIYDLLALSYTVSPLSKEWHVHPAAFGPIFGAATFGFLFGSFILGSVGDVVGRKPVIVGAAIWIAITTFATVLMTSTGELLILRLVAGFGLGTLPPTAAAIVAEFTPKHLRAAVITVMSTGIPAGTIIAGAVGATLLPRFGWHAMFYAGGVISLVLAAGILMFVPESPTFLLVRGKSHDAVRSIMAKIAPDQDLSNISFAIRKRVGGSTFTPAMLFAGKLALATPLVWLGYLVSSIAVFFMTSWLPLLIENGGLVQAQAALAGAMFGVGGLTGGLISGRLRLVDRYGPIASFFPILIASPIVALIGRPGLPAPLLFLTLFLAGAAIFSTHFSLIAVSTIMYPSVCRSSGIGWANGIAKIGSIAGPVIGGLLLGAHYPIKTIFLFAAVPPLVVAAIVFLLSRVYPGPASDDPVLDNASTIGPSAVPA
jgi:AAHS family 4-hydroxybenzoate transporter-like MFS transporter